MVQSPFSLLASSSKISWLEEAEETQDLITTNEVSSTQKELEEKEPIIPKLPFKQRESDEEELEETQENLFGTPSVNVMPVKSKSFFFPKKNG